LLERNFLRILETSSLVRRLHTHPLVLRLEDAGKVFHYTPDVLVEFFDGGALIEVKSKYFIRMPVNRERLVANVRLLRECGFRLVVVTEDDVLDEDLQEEIADLLLHRPWTGRFCDGLDTSLWDPLTRSETDFEAELRWSAAQRECDALLQRVMRRDPDDLVASIR
jgi:hypothetical protein